MCLRPDRTEERARQNRNLCPQNFVASTYTYLVERMHLALNKIVESRLTYDSPGNPISTDLYFYAEEAYELGHTDNARRHYRAVSIARYTLQSAVELTAQSERG